MHPLKTVIEVHQVIMCDLGKRSTFHNLLEESRGNTGLLTGFLRPSLPVLLPSLSVLAAGLWVMREEFV